MEYYVLTKEQIISLGSDPDVYPILDKRRGDKLDNNIKKLKEIILDNSTSENECYLDNKSLSSLFGTSADNINRWLRIMESEGIIEKYTIGFGEKRFRTIKIRGDSNA